MKTNKKNTFEILDSHFLNTSNNTINVDYFLENIYMQVDVVFRHDKRKREYLKTAKIKNIIWYAFVDFTNEKLFYYDYGTVCTNQHLKDYLGQYGKDYSIFDPLYEEIERIKKELEEV